MYKEFTYIDSFDQLFNETRIKVYANKANFAYKFWFKQREAGKLKDDLFGILDGTIFKNVIHGRIAYVDQNSLLRLIFENYRNYQEIFHFSEEKANFSSSFFLLRKQLNETLKQKLKI